MNCPTSDEDTFHPMPERTLFTSGKVVVSVNSVTRDLGRIAQFAETFELS